MSENHFEAVDSFVNQFGVLRAGNAILLQEEEFVSRDIPGSIRVLGNVYNYEEYLGTIEDDGPTYILFREAK